MGCVSRETHLTFLQVSVNLQSREGIRSHVLHRDGRVSMKVEAYCVKCKAKREIKDAQKVTLKNGRPAAKGTCPVCGTGMFKVLPKE